MILTFKPSIKLQKNKDGNLLVSFQNKVLQHEFAMNEYIWRLIYILGEGLPREQVIYRTAEWPKENRLEVLEALEVLIDEGIVEEVENSNYDKQQEMLKDGFLSRQLSYFSDYSDHSHSSLQILDILKGSHVAILGAGAIGSWMCYSLAQVGVGKITIIDDDSIELSNLNRQALYNKEDIGKAKIKVLKDKLKLINPDVSINTVFEKVQSINDFEVLEEDINIIVNCADVPSAYQTAILVSEFASSRNITCINGIGYNGNIGRIGLTTLQNKSMSWKDIYSNQENLYEDLKELEFVSHKPIAGSLSPISMFIASLHTIEVLKVLLPIWQPSFTNKVSRINFQNLNVTTEDFGDENSIIKQ